MRARDLAQPYPTATLDTDAMEAARAMASARLPGLLICDQQGRPYAVLPGSQVLRFVIPAYVQDDPALAGALDERASDELCRRLQGATVRTLLPASRHGDDLPVVHGDATALQVAALMARKRSPLVAVVAGERVLGVITVSDLLGYLLPAVGAP